MFGRRWRIPLLERIAGFEIDGFADEIDGGLLVTGLVRDDAQQMNRIGMLWIGSNDLLVEPLRLLQSSGLMMCDGGFQLGIQG